ncbi:Holliday junction branch migration protein RuvA [Oceanithermus sp.]|uniref:Holliday junction branch migration protein RuvA n=1 Tax=Oceanithermus sp. TaxID=2268145 RepID=UPI002579C91C|nr:Holliday junction branch migration protein RuvA [Oceanithermus sp.]
MVRFLEGVVLELAEDRAIVSLHGLGFEVFCPTGTLGRLRVGETARLHTRLVVREDSLTLYGFHDPLLLEWFDLLTGVSGVGPRVALGLLSALPADLLGQAVTGDDPKLLTAAPGVGRKLAERIVLELKTKLPDHLAGLAPSTAPAENPAAGEAAAALITLGFRETQVHAVVQKLAAKQPEAAAEELIRLALRELR